MKSCFRLFKRSSGIYFCEDRRTGAQSSLRTKDKTEATRLTDPSIASPPDPVNRLRLLLGEDVVLLPIKRGQKGPTNKGWQKTTIKAMADPGYLNRLRIGNIGVLLGTPSSGLCSIDIDDDNEIGRFLDLNPNLKTTLRTHGARGENFWVRIIGAYPDLTAITHEGTEDDHGKPQKWGEWRATGGQTVIHGRHPSGCDYQIRCDSSPVRVTFESIVWPDGLNLAWQPTLYQKLVQRQGQPFARAKNGAISLNQLFFVEKFAEEHVILHEPRERAFYTYDEVHGLWAAQTTEALQSQIGADLKSYGDTQDDSQIERKRTDALLHGLANMLRGRAEKREAFKRQKAVIHAGNGMLHLNTVPPELREFSPNYYSRNQSPIAIVEGADCPRFKSELLAAALEPEDIWLLQRWTGSLLLGGNQAQRIMLLRGTAGGGKGTTIDIVEKIIGLANVTELRTDFLAERFELFRYLGKTLLTGKDVPAEFLMRKGVSALKKLVGHDFLSAEGKSSNTCFDMRGEFDVVITANSRLRVRLEGDADAWRRRLMIIDYDKPKTKNRIANFADVLLREEAPGIMMWMIQGAMAHLEELKSGGDFVLTANQHDLVEALLAESDSVREFVRNCLKPEPTSTVTVEELLQAYAHFCEVHDTHPEFPSVVQRQLPDLMYDIHRIAKRNDIDREQGARRGFKGIRIEYED